MSARNDKHLLARLVSELSRVPGVRAIALGGSRARGSATAHSDDDVGIYYAPDRAFDIKALRAVAVALDDAGPAATVTAIGAWGPWINGGAWLTVESRPVDLLYRDLCRVRATIDQCRAGEVGRYYQPGHPHGFISVIYMGEIAYNRPLWDPQGDLQQLKTLTDPYPPALAKALVEYFLFEAQFSLENAHKTRAAATSTISLAAASDAWLACVKCCLRSTGNILSMRRARSRAPNSLHAVRRIFGIGSHLVTIKSAATHRRPRSRRLARLLRIRLRFVVTRERGSDHPRPGRDDAEAPSAPGPTGFSSVRTGSGETAPRFQFSRRSA